MRRSTPCKPNSKNSRNKKFPRTKLWLLPMIPMKCLNSMSTLLSSWFIKLSIKKPSMIKITLQKMILRSLCTRLSNGMIPLANLCLPFFWIFNSKFRKWVMMSLTASLKTKMLRSQKTSLARFKPILLKQSMIYLKNKRTRCQLQETKTMETC